jgi:hypothetical protein
VEEICWWKHKDSSSLRFLCLLWWRQGAGINEAVVSLTQGCTNRGRQVARDTKFCRVWPNICGSSVWNMLHITLLAPIILRWLLDVLENLFTPALIYGP